MSETNLIDTDYFDGLAEQLVQNLLPSGAIKKFVGNNLELIGQQAEAVVRDFVKRVLSPIRISTGAVIYPGEDKHQKSKQIDCICWSPNPFPAIFETENFAIVPRMSCIGIIEIKSSHYNNKVGRKIREVIDLEANLTAGDRNLSKRKIPASLGVVIRRNKQISDKILEKQIVAGKSVILIENDSAGNEVINTKSVLRLVNFLAGLRLRWHALDGNVRVKEEVSYADLAIQVGFAYNSYQSTDKNLVENDSVDE